MKHDFVLIFNVGGCQSAKWNNYCNQLNFVCSVLFHSTANFRAEKGEFWLEAEDIFS